MTQAIRTESYPELKDYEIVAKIGQGGVAQIYKARQKSLNRFVAVKFLHPEMTSDPDIVRRFDREAETIAALNHPHIVHVIDKGFADGRYYFVMEYVDGAPFRDIIYDENISLWEKLDIIVMTLKALDYAHKNGVIHRDIKPANILIDKNRHAFVADFGIAQIINKKDIDNTRSDVVMGTLAYMSPEQRESSANVDRTTDIYAVGIMLYEILTNKRPIGRYQLPSELNPSLPKRLDEIILKCLAENPKDRYQTAVELKDEILNVISANGQDGGAGRRELVGVESFIGKCQYLDTIKESKYGSTTLVENRETHEFYILKKNDKSCAGLKEARLLSRFKNDHIINIYGAGGDIRRLVILMEYARGGSLADRMVKTYPCEKAMEIIAQVARGLDFAHKNNIIHGNLRPSNILFDKNEKVKLTDFGFPPHYNMMEKNWYAPPERRNSKQGDIYAMGVILHQLLFGKNPAYDRAGRLFLGAFQKSTPAALQAILAKLLAIRSANRYHSLEDFLADWQEFKQNTTLSAPSPEEEHSRKMTRKNRLPRKLVFIAAGAVAVAAVAAIIFLLK